MGGGEGEGRGEEKIPCNVISKLHHFCTMPLLLLAFEHRLNPLRSLYRENVLNILGKEGILGGKKKKEEGKKKRKGGKNGGGKNRGTRHSRVAVHCAGR